MRPQDYRSGGQGQRIRFAIGQCTLGAILVARSERGICAISLGDDPETLACELQDRFPQAELIGGDAAFERLVAQVVGMVETPASATPGLPLDIRGTAFQERVCALQAIPAGHTASYADIAANIGQPRATRAVARACASNASRWQSPATAWSAATAIWPATAGAWKESANCCDGKILMPETTDFRLNAHTTHHAPANRF
jgi:AraC family transcriptional regulator of adaptative response/methylated-DNA-[protein]-cysteine methyltransferase